MAGETLLNFIQNRTTAPLEKQTLLCPHMAPIDRQSFLSYQFFVVFDSVNKIKATRREKVSEQQDADYSRRSMSSLTEELQTLLNSIHTSISMYLPHLSSYVFLCMLTYLISLSSFFLIFCCITSFSFFPLSLCCSLYLSDSSFFFILSVFFISSFLPLQMCCLLISTFDFFIISFSRHFPPKMSVLTFFSLLFPSFHLFLLHM